MNYISKLMRGGIKYLFDSKYRFLYRASLGKYSYLSDEEFIKKKYKYIFNKEINLDHPVTFNEKLQWLKLNDREPIYTVYVDKYLVREHIKEILGEQYLIPLLGVWDNVDQICFDTLPDQFVLKCNHNSGLGMCICKDKSQISIDKVKIGLQKGMRQDYYSINREWPYKNVPRKIIAEQYMSDESGEGLRDYKVLCFHGKAKFIEFHQGRFTDHQRQDFYTPEWNLTSISQSEFAQKSSNTTPCDPPATLNEMISLSEKLAQNLFHVRIDWYSIGERLYFGEITFYDGSGFVPFDEEKDDILLGNMIHLPIEHI